MATTIKSSSKNVATAGTAEQLSATVTSATDVLIKAKSTNTNKVYVGDSSIDNTGYSLAANETLSVGDIMRNGTDQSMDLTNIYLDVDTNGEGVEFLYVEKT